MSISKLTPTQQDRVVDALLRDEPTLFGQVNDPAARLMLIQTAVSLGHWDHHDAAQLGPDEELPKAVPVPLTVDEMRAVIAILLDMKLDTGRHITTPAAVDLVNKLIEAVKSQEGGDASSL